MDFRPWSRNNINDLPDLECHYGPSTMWILERDCSLQPSTIFISMGLTPLRFMNGTQNEQFSDKMPHVQAKLVSSCHCYARCLGCLPSKVPSSWLLKCKCQKYTNMTGTLSTVPDQRGSSVLDLPILRISWIPAARPELCLLDEQWTSKQSNKSVGSSDVFGLYGLITLGYLGYIYCP